MSIRSRSWALGLAIAAVLVVPAMPARGQEAPRRMTLAEAIDAALAHHPEAVAAETEVALARADLLEARGEWLPSLTLTSGYANSSSERVDANTGRLVSESYTAQASGSLLLFEGGRRIADNRVASASVVAADAEYRSRIFDTILATTEIFYEAAAASDLGRVAELRLERALQQLDFARTRLDVGTATASDVLRAELEVGNAELAVLDAASDLRTAGLELGRQVGIAALVHPVEAALPEQAPPLPQGRALAERAARTAPDVVAAEAILAGSEAARWSGFTYYLPSIRLSGGYDWIAFDFPPDRKSWSVRVSATLPLFDGFQREATLKRTAAALRLAEARARDATIRVQVGAESAAAQIESETRRARIADRAVALAQEDLRLLEERYQLGVATIVELQTSQVALSEAQIEAVRARQFLGMAVARLEAILGERIANVSETEERGEDR